MLKTWRRLAGLMSLGISVSVMTGCVPLIIGAAAGAGGVAYVQGVLHKNLDIPIDKLHRISLDALKRLKMTVQTEKVEGAKSTIKAEDVDHAKIKITINKLTENSSQLNIRVGIWGNQTKSQMVLNAIEKKI